MSTLAEARDSLLKGECTAVELAKACLKRIAGTNPAINACITIREADALEEAAALDKLGPDSAKPLWGVPVVVKDCITVKGTRTTCGSRMLENFVPFYDAFAVKKLKEAGAVIIAKTNMDEFAMGSSSETSYFGPVRNPRDLSRVPGGSSGGSAAAVAAGQAFAALGTDTGGSIRQPAAFCGCVGIKPTYGRVSRFGAVAYASSLDQIGPMARSVEDCAIMLSVIAGHDPKDSTSAPRDGQDYAASLKRGDLKGVTLGVPKEFWGEGITDGVRKTCAEALEKAKALGAQIIDVSMPHALHSVAVFYIIATAEASSNLARFDGVRYGYRAPDPRDLADLYIRSRTEGFGEEVRRRIMLGTYTLSSGFYDAYYKKAAQVRRLIQQDYHTALARCDALIAPVSPVSPWKLGEISNDPLKMYLMDIFTLSLNLAGLPGLSLPAGIDCETNMPAGIQLMGKPFDESALFAIGHALEGAFGRMSAVETFR